MRWARDFVRVMEDGRCGYTGEEGGSAIIYYV